MAAMVILMVCDEDLLCCTNKYILLASELACLLAIANLQGARSKKGRVKRNQCMICPNWILVAKSEPKSKVPK